MRRRWPRSPYLASLASLALLLACTSDSTQSPDEILPPGTVPVGLQEVASGLEFPLYLTAARNDARLFVVEKGGRIRIVKDGALLATPFLDLHTQVSAGSEQGLLGLAFDPDYASNGRFFVHYTNLSGDTRLSSFTVSSNPDIASTEEHVVLSASQPFSNHNGGQIAFGPDGLLYFGLGDGGGSGDPNGRGQDLTDLLGGILRIDVSAGTSYTTPADNPFVGQDGARPETWSYGLRNPWRFSFDRANGDLYIADVGQGAWEEIDVAPAAQGNGRGANYGWNRMEGSHCFGGSSCNGTGLTLPVKEYSHRSGCSVTGGYVYRGAAIPALQGHYFYSDFCSGWIRSFRLQDGTAVDQADWPTLRPGGSVPSFGEDAAGELYILDAGGKIYRVIPK